MKKGTRSSSILSLAILVAFAIGGGIYLFNHREKLSVLKNISLNFLLLLFFLAIIKLVIMGLFTKIIVGVFGIELRSMEWFGLSVISTMGNYLAPFRGGAALRGTYLNTKHGLSIPLFLSTLTVLYLISFSTNSFIGLIALGVLWQKGVTIHLSIFLFILLCFMSPFIFVVISRRTSKLPGKLANIVRDIFSGWRHIIEFPRILISLFINAALNTGVSLLIIHFSFLALGQGVPLEKSLIAAVLFLISGMIPITPAGLGIAEFALVVTSNTLGVDGTVSILAAGLNRAVIALTSILLGPFFSFYLSKQLPRKGHPKVKNV